MGDRMAMTPVCFKYRISGIMALWASATCVCWMHIWGIKVRQKYISVWYRHGICFLIVDCTLSLSLLLRQMPKLLCLYMKYVCIWVYTCVYICIYWWAGAGGHGSGAFAVEMHLSCTNPQKFITVYRTCLCAGAGRGVDLLLARWGCVVLALAHQCDPI